MESLGIVAAKRGGAMSSPARIQVFLKARTTADGVSFVRGEVPIGKPYLGGAWQPQNRRVVRRSDRQEGGAADDLGLRRTYRMGWRLVSGRTAGDGRERCAA